jgi:hypothetical protein
LFKLVSVQELDQTPPVVVAIQEHMEAATEIAGFGDIYKGSYVIADQEGAPFEYFENIPIVAKKNKVLGVNKSEEEQLQEVC